MQLSENLLKWAMRFYPPLFFQRIWVVNVQKGFTGVEVKIFKSIFNVNYNRSIFGGTIFSAADPFYAVLFHQALKRKGLDVRVWLKSSSIEYLKPAFTHLRFQLALNESLIDEAAAILERNEKFIRVFPLEIRDKNGQHCVTVHNEIYIKNISRESTKADI